MSQDLREMFRDKGRGGEFYMRPGHEKRFIERLDKELPNPQRAAFPWVKLAAVMMLLISLGAYILLNMQQNDSINSTVVDSKKVVPQEAGISLGDLSPDLKKVENYYMAHISLELSRLEISERNEVLIDSYMERLEELNSAYNSLTKELNEVGPNDQTITALIKNLQLRLQLLHKLQDKLKELKTQNKGSNAANAQLST
ncbi:MULTISPECIES: hypothetical protein [Arenibacter]|uniref:hypothetical protein n=1 Tax=Arenibacter TaxID=178469 RepID=UPI000A36C558|nr:MULTISPECIES: hypothetical protein [Arenibacter]